MGNAKNPGGEEHSGSKKPNHGEKYFDDVHREELEHMDFIKKDEVLSALCFSGGGVRSAAFSLGILQGLEKLKALHEFHYLSTVSGGGYIGAWLSAALHHGYDGNVTNNTLEAILSRLGASQREPETIRAVRANSKYLAPKGIFSIDTFTIGAIALRNFFLNLLVFVPFFIGVSFFPKILYTYFDSFAVPFLTAPLGAPQRWDSGWLIFFTALIAAFVFIKIFLVYRQFRSAQGDKTTWPIAIVALFGTMFLIPWCWVLAPGSFFELDSSPEFWLIPPCSAGLFLLAYVTQSVLAYAAHFNKQSKQPDSQGNLNQQPSDKRRGPRDYLKLWFGVLFSGSLFGITLLALLYLATLLKCNFISQNNDINFAFAWFLVTAPFFIQAGFAISNWVYLAMASISEDAWLYQGDHEREWFARANAIGSVGSLIWAIISACVLFGPSTVDDLIKSTSADVNHDYFPTVLASVGLGGAALGTGGAAAWIGSTARSEFRRFQDMARNWTPQTLAVPLAATFAILIIILSSYAGRGYVSLAKNLPLFGDEVSASLTGLVVFLVVALVASKAVNANRFSLQDLYRNRLVRTFLGAARPIDAAAGSNGSAERRNTMNRFTGFDPNDNIALAALIGDTRRPEDDTPRDKAKATHRRLFPIINAALNITKNNPEDVAKHWRERRAYSFTFSPLFCGAEEVGYRQSNQFGGKISLGTAMATSGAAASPNMGFYSNPAVTFLMTLFNARLGIWLGNPNNSDTWKRRAPSADLQIIEELFGITSIGQDWVYLSDGGHFDNLGLYEMFRRKCRWIVAVDAGEDRDVKFESLSRALRIAKIDFGVEVEFEKGTIVGRSVNNIPYARCLYGKIRYPGDADSDRGTIVVIRPCIHNDEPIDILGHARTNKDFPFDSTMNQFFGEELFESYRALGQFTVECIGKEEISAGGGSKLKEFLDRCKKNAAHT